MVIGENVTSIDSLAFYGCSRLKSIVVDEGNTTYDSRENCNAIIETASNKLIRGCVATAIPEGVTSIGKWAFSKCEDLETLVLPSTITSLDEEILGGDYGVMPQDIYCYAEEVPSAENAFRYTYIQAITLHVPESAYEEYKNTEPWSKFGNIVKEKAVSVVSVSDNAPTIASRYSLSGQHLTAPQRGINVVKMSDGTVKKVLVK